MRIKDRLLQIRDQIRRIVIDDAKRQKLILTGSSIGISIVSGWMTVVNLLTQKWLLLGFTLTFCLLCLCNALLSLRSSRGQRLATTLFTIEGLALCILFCLSGTPEGFSALWICCIPLLGFTLLGMRKGSIYSALTFVCLVFLFWTPLGRAQLHWDYTASFQLRFPMFYGAVAILSMLIEYIRTETLWQLRESERRYAFLYKHDALTGIYNRYGFNEQLDALFTEDAEQVALFILDMDLFKRVNDTHGHDVGDEVLRTAVQIICRQLDSSHTAVSRWGGEEFAVLLWNEPEPEQVAERIRRAVESTPICAGDKQINITVTIGVCIAERLSDIPIAQMVRTADQCLYIAKKAGRNQVCAAKLQAVPNPES